MRTKLTIACALAAFVAAGGGPAEATGLTHARTHAPHAITVNHSATHGTDGSRGGKALTEKEYWRAQWRDEGAVFPGDK
jgi:hypothetical protein